MKERPITEAVMARLRELGAEVVKVHASQYGNAGQPDVDACLRGRSVKVEVKVPGRSATPRQLAVLRRWQRAGALCGVVHSVGELDALLEHLDDPDWRNPDLV